MEEKQKKDSRYLVRCGHRPVEDFQIESIREVRKSVVPRRATSRPFDIVEYEFLPVSTTFMLADGEQATWILYSPHQT